MSDARDDRIKLKISQNVCSIYENGLELVGVGDLSYENTDINTLIYRYFTQSKKYPYKTAFTKFEDDKCGISTN